MSLSGAPSGELYAPTAGTVSSGTTAIITPPSGNGTRLHYYALNADGSNANPVTVTLQFAGAASPVCIISLLPGAIFARNIGAGRFFTEGAINAVLNVTLSVPGIINWIVETTPIL